MNQSNSKYTLNPYRLPNIATTILLCIVVLAGCDLPPFTDGRVTPQANDQTAQSPDAIIAQLYSDLEEHREQYFTAIQAAADLANGHQSLGLAFLEYEMYALALEQFTEALVIESHNEILHYYAGLAAANHSKAYSIGAQKDSLYSLALHHYQTSIDLNANYSQPRYALAVLYLYELEQPTQAISTLDALAMIQPIQFNHLILYGYAHTILGNYATAIDYYTEAQQATESEQEQRDLQHNIDSLKSLLNG